MVKLQEEKNLVSLIDDLNDVLQKKARQLGKDISWFQYARQKKHGFIFLKGREKQFKLLNEVVDSVTPYYKRFTKGEIALILSKLVNSFARSHLAASQGETLRS